MVKIFPYARLALKNALLKFNFKEEDVILVPDFNCNVIYQPIIELGIKLKFYPITNTFEPNWEEVEILLCSKTKAIMMVHYFGQPQNIEYFKNFCILNNILLIEDNSHGHSGSYNNILLGKYGDIGFSSPRKQLNLENGAVLYVNGSEMNSNELHFDNLISIKTIKQLTLNYISKFSFLKLLLKNVFLKKPDYSNLFDFIENEKYAIKIDLFSILKIYNSNWVKIGISRRKSWKEWVDFCKINKMTPIWETPSNKTCPWVMPVYVEDVEFRNKLMNASWETGLGFITWPSLPDIVLHEDEHALARDRWHKLICIPLYKSPKSIKKQINKFNKLISKNISK